MGDAAFWIWIGGMIPVSLVIVQPEPHERRRLPWVAIGATLLLWPVFMVTEMLTRAR